MGSPVKRALRFSVIGGPWGAPSWQQEAVAIALNSEHATYIGTFVVGEVGAGSAGRPPGHRRWSFLDNCLSRAGLGESRLTKSAPWPADHATAVLYHGEDWARNEDGQLELAEAAWSRIADGDLDFVVNLTGEEIVPSTAKASPFGIWSFDDRHGPIDSRDKLGACDLVEERRALSLFLVSRRSDRANLILREGHFFITPQSLVKTQETAMEEARSWLAHACRNLSLNGLAGAVSGPVAARAAAPKHSTIRSVIHQVAARLKAQVRYRFFRQHWNIAVIDRPIADVGGLTGDELQRDALSRSRWYPENAARFIADPFGYASNHGSEIHILAETYEWRAAIGQISATSYGVDGFGPIKPVLDASTHLSYPFIFQHGEETAFIPEHSQARDTSAFSIDGDATVKHKVTLLPEREIYDPTLLHHDETFWLFATEGGEASNTALSIYFADTVEGPWFDHPLNPVKLDICSARPAGTPFYHDGILYRPGQDSSRQYGGAVTLNRVDEISRTSYRETPVGRVAPVSSLYSYGLHTLSRAGDHTLIDGAEMRPTVPWLSDVLARLVRL